MKKILLFFLSCFCFAGNVMAQAQTQTQAQAQTLTLTQAQTQNQPQEQQSYIYCKVSIVYMTVRGKCDIYVDFGQFESKLLRDTMNMTCDMKEFNSEMAALNWLSRNGWELFQYSQVMDPEESNPARYIMRMNVTGLTEAEINERIAVLCKKGVPSAKPQNPDGTFPE